MPLATKRVIELITKNEDCRYIYHGTTTGELFGYPTDTVYRIYDDTKNQKTYHVPVLSKNN